MEKRILLFGNTDGLLGVKIDLQNYEDYFKSETGGEWLNTEIIKKINPSKEDLIQTIQELKSKNLDYLIVIFSGHGGMERTTFLEINPDGDLFSESRLENICKRQVTILDCCRAYAQNLSESVKNQRITKSFSISGTRAKFERRILQASEQQIKLYSCAEGECSYDTPEGGMYSKSLLEEAYSDDSEYIYFGRTHDKAAAKTTKKYPNQNPEIIQPRLLTSLQVIFGIN